MDGEAFVVPSSNYKVNRWFLKTNGILYYIKKLQQVNLFKRGPSGKRPLNTRRVPTLDCHSYSLIEETFRFWVACFLTQTIPDEFNKVLHIETEWPHRLNGQAFEDVTISDQIPILQSFPVAGSIRSIFD
uniref:Uncharacterized protein n=1 Tax=Cacopsylla melanoneura TaxID=428564 RepID=A0A8D8SXQ1_9HEMI